MDLVPEDFPLRATFVDPTGREHERPAPLHDRDQAEMFLRSMANSRELHVEENGNLRRVRVARVRLYTKGGRLLIDRAA